MSNSKKSADAMRIALALLNDGDELDQSPGGWGTVERKEIGDQLIDRLSGKTIPNQGAIGFCGGASFLYCLLKDRPDLYARLIVDLWHTGKARLGSMMLEPGAQLLRYTDTAVLVKEIDAIDWISMASVRDFDGNYKVPSNWIGQATTGYTMKHWFQAVGAKVLIDNTRVLGRVNWNDFLDISCYATSAWIVMLINANLLEKFDAAGTGSFVADHWVVVSDEIKIDEISASRLRPAVNNRGCVNPRSDVPPNPALPVDFTVFSWGNATTKLRSTPNTSIAEFLDRYHGALVFSHIP